jgi:hypothetical protein
MCEAFKRYDARETIIIPIILHDINWQETPLGKIQALPMYGIAVSSWSKRNEAWKHIDQGIRNVIKRLL